MRKSAIFWGRCAADTKMPGQDSAGLTARQFSFPGLRSLNSVSMEFSQSPKNFREQETFQESVGKCCKVSSPASPHHLPTALR
jgi:hypothetical protein